MNFSSKKRLLSAIFALIFTFSAFAQTDSKSNFGNFRKEIDLHFPVLRTQYDYGASLLFKKQLGESTQKKWARKNAVRASVGYGFEKHNNSFTSTFKDSVTIDNYIGQQKTVTGHVGFEKQYRKNRFEHWWALDGGVRIFNSKGTSIQKIKDGNTQLPDKISPQTIKGVAIGLTPIWGFRYFLSPRISAGFEISFPYEINKSTLKYTSNNINREYTRLIGELGATAPRFLFIGYHF
jgi:hypothetical protein